jgi:HTH-type transcriptional regulator / antitoxin HigA
MDKRLAEVYPPGEYLAAELESRSWSQTDFAEILGRPVQFVSEIISGKKEITRESAAQIGAALETSPELWLNLQNSYLLSRRQSDGAAQRQLDEVRRRARHNELAPIALLRKRGYLPSGSLDQEETALVELFGLNSIQDEPEFLAAARRSNDDVPLTPVQLGWLAVARKQARGLKASTYDRSATEKLASSLSKTVATPDGFSDLPRLFAAAGVRLTYVEAFPGSKMSGATFLLDEDPTKPVIAISGRGRRLDKVLFTVLHELAHLVRGDVVPGRFLLDEGERHTLGDEDATDALAGEWAVPGGLTERPKPIRQPWVVQEAARLGVNWIVVVGQLQNRAELDWKTQLVKGAPTVVDQLEGWQSLR